MVSYAVQLVTRYDGLVIASFPDLPGVTALGRDDEEAREEARRALADALTSFQDSGTELPPARARGHCMITLEVMAGPIPA